MQPRRLMLTGKEFDILVKGGEVERDGVTVALADIGFDRMDAAIDSARDSELDGGIVNAQAQALRLFLHVIHTGGGFPPDDPAVQAVTERAFRDGLIIGDARQPKLTERGLAWMSLPGPT